MAGEGNVGKNLAAILFQDANAAGVRMVAGTHATVAASDTVDTGLEQVFFAWAQLESDVAADPAIAQAVVGDQAGTPVSGSILIKTWTAAGVVATAFTKNVRWFAIGRPVTN